MSHKFLRGLGRLLILGSGVLGLWTLMEVIVGQHTFLGGPLEALRSILNLIIATATPIGVGFILLTLSNPARDRSD